jgi:hypothetical protein
MIYQPSDKEQEYFHKQEMERLKRLREEHRAKQAVEEAQRQKELHFMHCPKCGSPLETTGLEEVEVDICPGCGGVFLDAGELDKIVEGRNRGGFGAALERFRAWWKE